MCQFSLGQAQISKHTPLGGVAILVVTTSIHPSHLLVGDVRLNQERARYAGTQSGVDFPLSGFSPEKGGRLLSFKWTFRGVLAEFLGFVGGSPRVIEGVIESLVHSVFFNHVFFFPRLAMVDFLVRWKRLKYTSCSVISNFRLSG